MNIRPCESIDIEKVKEIYNFYIDNTVITFEDVPLSTLEMSTRISTYTNSYPWLVCEVGGVVRGFAYAARWKERSAYKNTVEVSVYLESDFSGNGYGTALYAGLFKALEPFNLRVILGCIALPNQSSVKLHEKLGFIKVAHFSGVGRKFGRWLDVGYWQKTNA
jgi:Sortase and related acyltransferases